MAAIPQSQQEEVVASKEVTAINMLARLMTCYQPGGLSEKGAILSALDSPEEAAGLSQAVTGLRRWLRWHRRAGEIGVVRPDSTILVKGLGRLTKRVLRDNPDLALRIQLAKSSLQIDTAPCEDSVMTFAHHLLAEFEQVAHQDRRKREDAKNAQEAKAKRIEENGSGGKGAEGKGGKGEKTSTPPCKFFLSDGGCKKGKSCSWSHVTDEKRRCWICGSVAHLAPACDRPREASKENGEKYGKGAEGKGSQKMAQRQEKKEEGAARTEELPQPEASSEEPSSTSVEMKGLLEEATKMLKGLTMQSNEKEQKGRQDRLAAMQDQLDELRKVRVLKISKMGREETVYGLLDSGATHPMRAARPGEDLSMCENVRVTLADGHQVDMVMTPKGIMVVEDGNVEPCGTHCSYVNASRRAWVCHHVERRVYESGTSKEGCFEDRHAERVSADPKEEGTSADSGVGRRKKDEEDSRGRKEC